MKSTAKKLAVCAAAFCLLACGTAVSAAAASPVSGLALSGITMPWDQNVPAESIEAGSYTANMLLGSSQQLSPVVRPRNSTDSVVYISDDTSILTVSNTGVVQAVGVGTTRITAAAGNQICAYTIVVSMDSSMIVTEMDLSLSSNTIYVGNSVSAQLQVRPTSASNYATVALTSSNEKVATVNNFGRVTGIAPGTATITATCGSVTATTNVTVMSIPNSSTGTASTGSSNSGQVVTVNPSYVVLKPGATRTLTASVKPSSASQKFTFKSANSNIATVSPSGVITAVGTGATSITVSNGTASARVTVIVNRSAASEQFRNGISARDHVFAVHAVIGREYGPGSFRHILFRGRLLFADRGVRRFFAAFFSEIFFSVLCVFHIYSFLLSADYASDCSSSSSSETVTSSII